MPASAATSRQSSVSVVGLGRVVVMGAVAVLILVAGVWGSWGTAQYVMLTKGRESGTVKVASCTDDVCSGSFAPVSAGARARGKVDIAHTVAVRKGQTYAVVVKPGTDEVLRSGLAGVLYAWVPFGGALLLASVVVGGGLRLGRIAWILAGAGVVLLTSAFVAL